MGVGRSRTISCIIWSDVDSTALRGSWGSMVRVEKSRRSSLASYLQSLAVSQAHNWRQPLDFYASFTTQRWIVRSGMDMKSCVTVTPVPAIASSLMKCRQHSLILMRRGLLSSIISAQVTFAGRLTPDGVREWSHDCSMKLTSIATPNDIRAVIDFLRSGSFQIG
jgi:hypothetical protein